MTTNNEPTKRRITKHGNDRWELDFGADANGKRHRRVVETEAEADKIISECRKEIKRCGDYWARLPQVKRQVVVATLQEMESQGQNIAGVWQDWHKWKAENQNVAVTPQPYVACVDEFERRKLAAGKTKRYVRDTIGVLRKFGAGREQQHIHKITAADLEAWIDSHETWGLSSRRTNMSLFSSLWEVAIAKGWCSLNIVDRLEPVGKLGRVVKIYPNDTVLNLMAAAMGNEVTQQVIAPLALGFFGCMRPEEVSSVKALDAGKPPFGWDCIDLQNGLATVSVDVAKTGDQRTIRLQPAAVEWLKLAKELKNPLPPENETRLVDQCCELIGLEEWIRDGLRKNCATHLRVVYKNDYDVIKDMGNSVRILLKHYADLHVPESVSLEHWHITPEKVRKYMKTDEWKRVVETAAKAAYEKAKRASGEQPAHWASGTSRRAH